MVYLLVRFYAEGTLIPSMHCLRRCFRKPVILTMQCLLRFTSKPVILDTLLILFLLLIVRFCFYTLGSRQREQTFLLHVCEKSPPALEARGSCAVCRQGCKLFK